MSSPARVETIVSEVTSPGSYRSQNVSTGAWGPTYTINRVCTSSIFCANRMASQSSSFVNLNGVRWRPPKPWVHESLDLRFSVGAVTTTWNHSNKTTRTESVWPANMACGSISRALFSAWPPTCARFKGISKEKSSLLSEAETKALAKIKLGDVEWGETIFQWRQTASLFTNNVRSIARDVRRFRRELRDVEWRRLIRRRSFKERQKARKGRRCRDYSLSQKWLELVYGWIPLLSDIYGSIVLLSDTMSLEGMVVCGRGKAYGVTEEQFDFDPAPTLAQPGPHYELGYTFRTNHQVACDLWYRLDDIEVARVSALGLVNPAQLAWNLLPWTFVLDWLLPIGPWLGSFTADSGFEFMSGTTSYKREVIGVSASGGVFEGRNGKTYFSGATYSQPSISCEAAFFRRNVLISRPVPGLYFKNPLSPVHVMNAIALLRQAFR